MSDYGTALIARQRAQIGFRLLVSAVLFAALATKVGLRGSLIFVAAVALLTFGIPTAIFATNRAQEGRRRRAGAAPGWPAQLPTRYLPSSPPSHARSDDVEIARVSGRLSLTPAGFVWTPSARVAKTRNVTTVRWNPAWVGDVQHGVRWLGQGVLTLRSPTGEEVHLVVRNCDDLANVIATNDAATRS